MRNSTKRSLLSLALAITKKNVVKGINTAPKNYVKNKKIIASSNAKTKIVKEDGSVIYFLRDKMSGKAFSNMLDKKDELISDFLQSDNNVIRI